MIVHIVCFKLVDKSKTKEVKNELLKLKTLHYTLDLEIIEKFIHNKVKGDIVLFSRFKNEEQLNYYMKDPLHIEVISNTNALIKNKDVIDFEM